MNSASPDAGTRLYGLFGDPVGHSLSPLLHNALFREKGINAAYLAFRVEADWLGLAFEAMRAMGMAGVNLTVPHKEQAVDLVDEIPEDLDRAVGALNTVVNRDGRLFGHNTDVPGFLIALREDLSYDPAGKVAVVAGAGGVARAAVFALARANAERIFIVNRSRERAAGLADYAGTFFPETDIEAADPPPQEVKKVSLIVNATSLGLSPRDPAPLDVTGGYPQSCAVFDTVYSQETALLKAAQKAGLRHAGGLGMLVNQAALAFELWTGIGEGVRESMRDALQKAGR